MSGKVIKIERVKSRPGVDEEPYLAVSGYKLADPKFGDIKHHGVNAVYVRTLDEAADLIGRGFSLWMVQKGKRESLISPGSLRIIRAP